MRFILLFAAALACANPVAARPVDSEQEYSTETIANEMAAYGQWLARLTAITSPMQTQYYALAGHWRELERVGFRNGSAGFRSTIADMLASSDQVIAQLEALETPDFPALDLDEDIKTAAMRRDTISLISQMRAVIEEYDPLLDAVLRNDKRAALAANGRQIESLRLVFESQVLLGRAALAATPREDVTWEITNIDYLYFRISARVLEAFAHARSRQVDSGISSELMALASEVETTVRVGAEKLETQISDYEDQLEDARKSGDAGYIQVIQRAIAVMTAFRELFPLGNQLAAVTRGQAETLRTDPISEQALVAFFQQLRPLRADMDRIGTGTIAAMAGEP